VDLIETERREPNQKRKTIAFLLVMGLIMASEIGKGNAVVDRVSHATVIAFMGARIFFRNI
jgi:hypothetical protein